MAKRGWIWAGAGAALVAATAGLVAFATLGAASFRVDGTAMILEGPLSGASVERFEMLVEQHPELQTLVLGNVPGTSDITALVQKGYRVRSLGFDTVVAPDAVVEGDAVLLFLAGNERVLGEGAALVVSDWSHGGVMGSALAADAPAHEERRRYVADMLGEDGFYWFSLEAVTGGAPHRLNRAEIAEYGLETAS